MVVVTDIKLKKIAGYLGLLQGATWAILSLICICVSSLNIHYYNNHFPDTYMGAVKRIWFMFYLTRDYRSAFPNQIMRPKVFFNFMWPYFILNLLWFFASLRVLKIQGSLATIKNLNRWSSVTAVICFCDLLMVILLGADYQKCLNFSNHFIDVQETCSLGVLPVLVIAAKGFTLWVVNVIFVKVIVDLSKELKTHNSASHHPTVVSNARIPQTVIQTNVVYVPQCQPQTCSLPPPYENHPEFKNNVN